MTASISTYDKWVRLSQSQKVEVVNNVWAPEYKKGKSIRKAILSEFKKKYAKRGVKKVEFREYKYLLGIFVTVEKGCAIRLPRRFDIFFVQKQTHNQK